MSNSIENPPPPPPEYPKSWLADAHSRFFRGSSGIWSSVPKLGDPVTTIFLHGQYLSRRTGESTLDFIHRAGDWAAEIYREEDIKKLTDAFLGKQEADARYLKELQRVFPDRAWFEKEQAMSTQLPKDGYYMATVVLDTGGSIREYVQVQGGKVFTKSASELLPEACSDFFEIGPIHFVCVFPGQAAIELEDLRAEVARLRQWIADLEVLDGPNWIPSGCQLYLGDPPPQHLTPTQPDPHYRPS